MQNVRPSILQRNVRPNSRAGNETADDAWIKEEKRLEARRARVQGYETQFRVTHTYDATPEERRDRIVGLQNSHAMLERGRQRVQEREKELDRQFALNQASVAAQEAAEEQRRLQAKKQAEIDAMRLNRDIAESRRAARKQGKQRENELDNEMIQQALSARRTFLS